MSYYDGGLPLRQIPLVRSKQQDDDHRSVLHVNEGRMQTLSHDVKRLYVVSGTAWITMNGDDHILRTGEVAEFNGGQPAMISAMRKRSLTYRVES